MQNQDILRIAAGIYFLLLFWPCVCLTFLVELKNIRKELKRIRLELQKKEKKCEDTSAEQTG